ncbi:uncharacterized protein BO95DRAFT_437675 [Aspergillus brunneoviolaceus CBS 621.78]|uniref:Uncharacterized protein n=1 Tax=Aspergillus brunneoviolaceus CBS 621.78 TaxID=1450534 RepID=A0ACD1GQK0_9EURO|nr:hypothetical protein BO95DRAFT_437675 [Aspergillus brunneoviolaceus CBS 621.78]RAH51497.1 hypothetical protein BO95DRAFT_437675 [Aspergillus brunneoviolaceus CBS 621.78]
MSSAPTTTTTTIITIITIIIIIIAHDFPKTADPIGYCGRLVSTSRAQNIPHEPTFQLSHALGSGQLNDGRGGVFFRIALGPGWDSLLSFKNGDADGGGGGSINL